MGGSRRRYKRSRAKVQVGRPKKNPHIFKPAFNLPPKSKALLNPLSKWDEKGSVIENYKSFGVISNPNYLGVRSRTPHIVESDDLQMPPDSDIAVLEFDPIDSGSDLEEDDLKSALGKKRTDGKQPSLQPLTATQRLHVSRLRRPTAGARARAGKGSDAGEGSGKQRKKGNKKERNELKERLLLSIPGSQHLYL